MTFEPTAEVTRVNQRLKELHDKLPGARALYDHHADEMRRWKVYARYKWSLDGTTDESKAETKDYLIIEAPSPTEALARSHRVANDPHAKLYCLEKLLRGVSDEPVPLTDAEKAEEARLAGLLARQKERAIEGARNYMRNALKAGVKLPDGRVVTLEMAKAYNKKTGLLDWLVGSGKQIFDFGRR